MTTSAQVPTKDRPPLPPGHVRLIIDGIEVTAPKGEMVIRTCERVGIEIPRFCEHPLLDPIAACRQCMVEVQMGGRKLPKPQPACATVVAEDMVVATHLTSAIAARAQKANLEFLLVNHPLDCPMCDKGGECPLQNQTLVNGPGESRFHEAKKVFVKPVPISTEILLDRDRCIQCYRCTRVSEQIAGDPFIDMATRGTAMQVATGPGVPFQSYFSGNTIQICPVGALTSTAYRFRSRPFDLVSSPSICEHCAAGCALRTDHRSNVVLRRLAGDDPEVNEEWNCDKGRFAFNYFSGDDRLRSPLVRNAHGELVPASWTDAMAAAATGLAAAKRTGGVGVLAGGRLTVTDAYAYAKFARVVLGTNDADFRARDHSAEELTFLTDRVVGTSPRTGGLTYTALETAPAILLVALEPEEECPILFLRLRKASRCGTRITAIAPWASAGLCKTAGALIAAGPGDEPAAVRRLAEPDGDTGIGLRQTGAAILVGERAAQIPGLLTEVGHLADTTGAGLAWVPRRAGERGALEVGAVPTLLPGARAVVDPAARAEVESAWGLGSGAIPSAPGRDTADILAASAAGELGGLLVGGVELADLPDPAAARDAVAAAGFVVSLELRRSEVTDLADVVLPVAAAAEKAGAYLDWEGRVRPFDKALKLVGGMDDARVLDTLAAEMGVDLCTRTPQAVSADLARLAGGQTAGSPGPSPAATTATTTTDAPPPPAVSPPGQLRLACWRMLLDDSRSEDGESNLAGTRRPVTARIHPEVAAGLGLDKGDLITITGSTGSLTLPALACDIVEDVVWVPGRIGRRSTCARLGVAVGDVVSVARAATDAVPDTPEPINDSQSRLGDRVSGMGGMT